MRKRIFYFLLFTFPLFANQNKSPFILSAKKGIKITVLISTQTDSSSSLVIKKVGSGFFISSDGKIATLYSLVKEGEVIAVMLPDKSLYSAHLIGGDLQTGVALIKIAGEEGEFLFAEFADSDEVEVGDPALATGYLKQRVYVAQKMISRKEGKKYLITDRGFNLGDLGGPLLNLEGDLIGMLCGNTHEPNPLGVVIPSNQILETIAHLE
ncbi:MAG: serine protease [Simkania negevensis]|nr:serine protease [Simkania negevensis]